MTGTTTLPPFPDVDTFAPTGAFATDADVDTFIARALSAVKVTELSDEDLASRLTALATVTPTAGTAAKPIVRSKIAGGIKRPNGEEYFARPIKVTGDEDLLDVDLVKTAYENRIPVLMYGPPGTGKTALAEASMGEVVTLSCTADTETADFIGGWVQEVDEDGTVRFTWVDGPMLYAMENGLPFFIDEIALADSRQLALVYSVMDGRDEITVTANPRRGKVKAKPGFYILAACNPHVPGAVMSDALLSRFSLQIEVLTDFNLARKMGVPAELITVAKTLKRREEKAEVSKSPQMRELLAFVKISETFGQSIALSNFIASADEGDRDIYSEVIGRTFGTDFEPLRIGRT